MLWACSAANGTGALQRVNGIMKKEDYLQILQDNLKSSARRLGLGHSWVFQQHNDPKHTSKVVMEWLNQARIKVLEWPSQSPDLNSIENMWAMLKKQVHVRKPQKCCWTAPILSRGVVKDSTRSLPEACGWLPKAPNWSENGQGTCNQILALLYVYFWPSRFGHIFSRPIINS